MELGITVRDRITNFEGVVVGFVQYLTGCNQALVTPRGTDPSKRPESEWFDVQRLDRVSGVETFALNNGNTPGCDRAAPKI